MSTPVYAFVWDRSFINPSTEFISLLEEGGIGRLSQNGLSFFNDLEVLKDTRSPTSRDISFTTNYTSSLLVDNYFFSSFVSALNDLSSTQLGYIFQIIDALFFKTYSSISDLETYLTTTTGVSDFYVANSVTETQTEVTDTVYPVGNSTGEAFSTHPQMSVTLNIPSGNSTLQFSITFYCQNQYWINNYPESNILGVAPPLSYEDLLSLPLNTTNANILSTASSTATLNYTSLTNDISSETASGYLSYEVKINDTANNTTVVAPFNILYKGTTPSLQDIRTAIKNAITQSGVGTTPEWKQRIPELFIQATFYLIPLYDVNSQLVNQVLYPSIVDVSTAISRVSMILPLLGTSYINQNLEIVSANYEGIMMACIGEPMANGNTPKSLLQMHPDYQNTSSTSTAFNDMPSDTQQFCLDLSECLTIAFGNGTSTIYFPQKDQNLTYVSFISNEYEYCVITKECYTDLLQSTGVS